MCQNSEDTLLDFQMGSVVLEIALQSVSNCSDCFFSFHKFLDFKSKEFFPSINTSIILSFPEYRLSAVLSVRQNLNVLNMPRS